MILPSGESEPIFGGAGVPGGRLFIRWTHAPDGQRGAVLSEGQLTYKVSELIRADPLGVGGTVDVGEMVDAGSVTIQPVFQ